MQNITKNTGDQMDDYPKSIERKELEKLASAIADVVQTDEMQQKVAQVQEVMLLNIRKALYEMALQAFLSYRGGILQANDQEWARVMASSWITNEDAMVPTSPFELKALITSLQHERETALARVKLSEGYQEGWHTAYTAGVRFGWGACNMGKGLAEAEQAAGRTQPSHL
jgi:hypothetical protein